MSVARYTYTEFFQRFPEVYTAFHRVVDHAGNFHAELVSRGLLRGETMLSIGAGEGELEARAAAERRMRVSLVEPSASFMDAARSNFSAAAAAPAEAFTGTFQDYVPTGRHDLVLSIHSWYALGLDKALLRKALDCVRAGGRLFVALISRASPVYAIARGLGNDPVAGGLCAEQLSDWARKTGFDHEYFENARALPVGRVFSVAGELTEDGRALACLPAFTPWSELDVAAKRSAAGALRAAVVGDRILLKNGCLVFMNA